MDDSDPKRRRMTQKERAKQLRRDAYQKAKARRAADPRYLAMKEALKERRRAAYQTLKAKRKQAREEEKVHENEERAARRSADDEKLMSMVRRFTGPS